MIIKYFPIRLDGKFETQEVELIKNGTIEQYLKKTEFNCKEFDTIVDGEVVKPDFIVPDNSEICVTPKIEGPVGAALWSFATWVTGATTMYGVLTFYAAVLTVAYSVYSALTANKPRLPSFGDSGLDEKSPTYGWEGIRTVQEVGAPVKVIYGEHRTGGNIINQFVSTDGDKQYLNILIGICEGEIESIDDILINEQPIANFSGITTYKRYGTNDQDLIPGFEDLHNVYNINTELTKDNSYTYTTTDSDVEAFEISLNLQGGLFQVDKTNGSIKSWSVTYKVEYRVNGAPSWIDLGTTTISDKSRTTLRRVFRKDGLDPEKYDIRITRTSDDSSLDPQKQGDLFLISVDEIKYDDLIYPNTALLGIKALATEQLSRQTPNITFVVKGLKIRTPAVLDGVGGSAVDWEDYYYDSDAEKFKLFSDDSELYWDEATYRTEYCANPVWCLRDLQLNSRYGIGEHIESTDLNDDQLLEEALVCEEAIDDGEGSTEKRYRMDVVIDSPSVAPDIMTQLSAVFNAFPFYSQSGYSFRVDRATDTTQIFGMGNIVKHRFEQTWKSRSDIYNTIEVNFMDKDLDYENETIAVRDDDSIEAGDPIRKQQLRVYTNKKSYAIRAARYALWVSKYLKRTATITCGIDALLSTCGDRIGISHDVPQWGFSGIVLADSTTTTIKLDREITLLSGTNNIMIRFDDDTIEEREITTASGSTVSEVECVAFSKAPSLYDKYSIGQIDNVIKPFRIMGLRRKKDGEVEISAIEYNESIYDDSGVVIPTNNYSSLSRELLYVTDLSLTERLIKLKSGDIENVIDVWFDKPDLEGHQVGGYKKGKVYLSDDDGDSWQYKGETSSRHFAIIGDIVDLTEYTVAVTSVNSIGEETVIDDSPQQIISIVGKTAPPSDVSSFILNQDRDRLVFGWSEVSDVDVWGYEIRRGGSWAEGATIAFVQANKWMTTDMEVGVEQSYWIKAIDTSGNYSETATEATITVSSIPYKNIIEEFSEAPTWPGSSTTEDFNIIDNDANSVLDNSDNQVIAALDVLEVDGGSLVFIRGLQGTYTTEIKDLGFVSTFSMTIEKVVTIDESLQFDSDKTLQFDTSATRRFTGAEYLGEVDIEIRTSEDNITWEDWRDFQKGDYNCRYYQLRITLERENEDITLVLSTFDHKADLPDVLDKGDDEVTVAADGKAVLFDKIYHQEPVVNISITSGDGVYFRVSSKTTTGFTVKLYDADGNLVTGEFEWNSYGV